MEMEMEMESQKRNRRCGLLGDQRAESTGR